MPTIRLKRSTTPDDVPTAAQLVSGELAINPADGRLYMKLESGAIIRISVAINTNTLISPTTWTTTSSYTGSSTNIDLSTRLNHKVSVTPATYSPFTSATAMIRLPLNSSIAISTGYSIWIEQTALPIPLTGTGTVIFSEDSGVTVTLPAGKKAETSTVGALVRLLKTATNTWSLTGDLDNV